MGITYGGLTIPGAHGAPKITPYEPKTLRRYHAGLQGQTEVRLGIGGRTIDIEVWIFNGFSTYTELQDWLKNNLDAKAVETNASLVLTGDTFNSYTFENCTFDGFERTAPPIPDVAGTVDTETGKWFIEGILHFWQLKAS